MKPISGTHLLNSFGAENIARQRQGVTVVHNDIQDDPSNNQETWAAIETRSFVSVPLVSEGRLKASLYVNQREARVWSPEEVSLIEDAARIWKALKRARAEEDQRKTEERLTIALEAGGAVGTWNCDVPADRLSATLPSRGCSQLTRNAPLKVPQSLSSCQAFTPTTAPEL